MAGVDWSLGHSKNLYGKPLVLSTRHLEVEIQRHNSLMRARFKNHSLWHSGTSPGLRELRRLARVAFTDAHSLQVAQLDLAADFVGLDFDPRDRRHFKPLRGKPHDVSTNHPGGEFTGFLVGSRGSARHGRIYDKTRELKGNAEKRDRLDHYPGGRDVTRVEVSFKRKRIERVLGTSDPARVFRRLDRLWADAVGTGDEHGWLRHVGRSGNVSRKWKAVQGVEWPELEDLVDSRQPRQAQPDLVPQLRGLAVKVAAERLLDHEAPTTRRDVLRAIVNALVDDDEEQLALGRAGLAEQVQAQLSRPR